MRVQVTVTTDSFEDELSWKLVSSDGNTTRIDSFPNPLTTYVSNLCADPSLCHNFTIYDSFGNGLLSGGDFSLVVDGELLLNDPEVRWSSLNVAFGSCTNSSSSPTPDPTLSTTLSPTSNPTYPITECDSEDELNVVISVTTDNYPEEQSWKIIEKSDGSSVDDGGDFTSTYTTYNANLCLDNSICYTFVVYDSYGDGLFAGGDFSLTVDNNVVLTDLDGSWSELSTDFGNCVDCIDVRISVTTDDYPSETSWTLTSSTTGNTIGSASSYSSSYTTFDEDYCLDHTECYSFVILDSVGDGIYNGGDFEIKVDGVVLLSNPPFQDWSSQETSFGNCR